MPGVGGLSIANNLLANQATLGLNENQAALATSTERLSTGLRINSAADDPSGLAIAESLQAQVNGFDQASRNITDAQNAATVAEGALQTTTDILQRLRTLAVEASNGLASSNDQNNLQAEISQLIAEVNRISENTNFNGTNLLDGSHAGYQAGVTASTTIYSNSVLATNANITPSQNTNYGLLVATISQGAGFNTTFGPVAVGTTAGGTVDGTIELQVINTGTSIAVQEAFFNSATGAVTQSTTLYAPLQAQGVAVNTYDNVYISFGDFTSSDVGDTAYIKISQNVASASNPAQPALSFQSGAVEGAVILLGLQATNAATLRIANINLLASNSSNPTIGAEDAIGQVDHALQTVLTQRAVLGASIVRLGEDQNNDNIASVNLQASESQIRDLNVAEETTNYTKLNLLVNIGTSVLAQANQNPESILKLFP